MTGVSRTRLAAVAVGGVLAVLSVGAAPAATGAVTPTARAGAAPIAGAVPMAGAAPAGIVAERELVRAGAEPGPGVLAVPPRLARYAPDATAGQGAAGSHLWGLLGLTGLLGLLALARRPSRRVAARDPLAAYPVMRDVALRNRTTASGPAPSTSGPAPSTSARGFEPSASASWRRAADSAPEADSPRAAEPPSGIRFSGQVPPHGVFHEAVHGAVSRIAWPTESDAPPAQQADAPPVQQAGAPSARQAEAPSARQAEARPARRADPPTRTPATAADGWSSAVPGDALATAGHLEPASDEGDHDRDPHAGMARSYASSVTADGSIRLPPAPPLHVEGRTPPDVTVPEPRWPIQDPS